MARHVKEVLEELFKGRDAALEKYAKVRMTQYEMNLWRVHRLPLSEVSGAAKQYFSKRFLNGKRINTATEAELKDAFDRLGYAVSNGCHNRCKKLVEELNESLKELEIEEIKDIEQFLYWLTFSNHTVADYYGNPTREPEYGFEILIFDCDANRKEFWAELQNLMKDGKIMSMQEVSRIVTWKRKNSKTLK